MEATVYLERFSIECRKIKTKAIKLANHKGHRQYSDPIKTRNYYIDAKRGKTCASKSRLVLVLLLIGGKNGASFLSQSYSMVVQN